MLKSLEKNISQSKKVKFLLCDDDERIKEIFDKFDCNLIWISSPQKAMDFLEAVEPSEKPDIAVFDINFSLGSNEGERYEITPYFNTAISGICFRKKIKLLYSSHVPLTRIDFTVPRQRFIPKKRLNQWLAEKFQ